MSIQFIDSFHYVNLEDGMSASSSQPFLNGWMRSTVYGYTYILRKNFGRYEMSATGVGRILSDKGTTNVTVGVRFRASRRGPNLLNFIVKGDTKPLFHIDWPNVIAISDGDKQNINSGAISIILDTDYYIEVQIDAPTKLVTIKINGYDYLTATVPSIPSNLKDVMFSFGSNVYAIYGDYYVVDGTSGKNKSFLSPQIVESYLATDRSPSSSWSAIPPNKNPIDIVNNNPPNLREFTQSNSVGAMDFYSSTGSVFGDIKAVQVRAYLSKTDIDEQKVALGVMVEGTDPKLGDDITINDAGYYTSTFETNNADQDWTAEAAQTINYGIIVQPR